MNLEEKLQAKLKELEALKAKVAEYEEAKNKTIQAALEVQGAAKQLVELINDSKKDASTA